MGHVIIPGRDLELTHVLNYVDLVPPECVLYLPGMPHRGGRIRDFSKYANHGTISGATWTRLPSGLWALSFDGDDYVSLGTSLTLNPGTNWSFRAWIRPTNVAVRALFSTAPSSLDLGHIQIGLSASKFYVYRKNDAGDYLELYNQGANTFTANVQVMITVVKEGAVLRTYVGVDLWNEHLTFFSGTFSSALEKRLGYAGAFTVNGYIGTMALATETQEALSIQKITNAFNQERPLFGV